MQYDSKMFLLKKTIQDLRHSKYIKKIILLLGPEVEKSLFKDIDVDKIVTRPKYLSSPILGQWPSIAYSLDGEKNINDKSFLILQENYPFRNHEQIDKLIKFYEKSSSKVVMYGQKIRNTIFEKKHDKLKPIGLPFIPKILSKQDYFSALKGFSMIADAKTLTKEISIHEDLKF